MPLSGVASFRTCSNPCRLDASVGIGTQPNSVFVWALNRLTGSSFFGFIGMKPIDSLSPRHVAESSSWRSASLLHRSVQSSNCHGLFFFIGLAEFFFFFVLSSVQSSCGHGFFVNSSDFIGSKLIRS